MTIKEFFQSKFFNKAMISLLILLVVLIIFQTGVFVGYRKAQFSNSWNRAVTGDINDPRSVFAPFMMDRDDRNPHGAIGEIISIKLPSFMVKGPNSAEEVVTIGPKTSIRSPYAEATTSDLKIGSQVIVIGSPDEQGIIHATFVRMMPPPPVNGPFRPGVMMGTTTK